MPTDGTGNAKVERRLAAILAADIAGYSALMGADEDSTVRDLKAHQSVILPMIKDHGGRVIDTAGDGVLAEFASAVNSVKCALAIQKTMAERNLGTDPARRMQFRIGVNLGDVIYDDTRIYGDGINVAARLETIADPGGICVSDKVHQEMRGKVDVSTRDLGPQMLKNIAEPVRVYRVDIGGATSVAPHSSTQKPALALPDKPSIAVLPFGNMSGDPSQEYFSDGITEDIITELSRFSELFVIARNSSFQYKGKSPDIRQVGRELGVRYVLEGSIRRAGDRIRITAQLIDGVIGAHLWAERYDRELKDIFAVQDEVARTIVTLLAVHVSKAEATRTLSAPPSNWLAHDYYLQASQTYLSFLSTYLVDELYETRRLLEKSIGIDSRYSRAYALLSNTYIIAYQWPADEDYLNSRALDRAHQLASKAVQLDPNLPLAHAKLGLALSIKGELEAGIEAFEKAFALNPNFTEWRYVVPFLYSGRFDKAIEVAKAHMRLDPFYPPLLPYWHGYAHYMLKQYAEALPLLRECLSRSPNARTAHSVLAATYARLGREKEAKAEAAETLRIDPHYTISGTQKKLSPFKFAEDEKHLFDGLRQAGLPEGIAINLP